MRDERDRTSGSKAGNNFIMHITLQSSVETLEDGIEKER